jgi:hypothetical protein
MKRFKIRALHLQNQLQQLNQRVMMTEIILKWPISMSLLVDSMRDLEPLIGTSKTFPVIGRTRYFHSFAISRKRLRQTKNLIDEQMKGSDN